MEKNKFMDEFKNSNKTIKDLEETRTGELSDDDLSAVAGGCKGKWVRTDTVNHVVKCPFCGKKIYFTYIRYENTRSKDVREHTNPNNCTCGASIAYATCTMNFTFEKNGERRIAYPEKRGK